MDVGQPQALNGIRILDLSSGIAGPLGVLLLAEHGADVIKIERPGGDRGRGYDGSRVWNRSRRSAVLDLKASVDVAALLRLCLSADVVVESFRPGVLERLGIGWARLHETNPGLVLVSCPGYPAGHRLADRPGYDALVQASSGQMWEQPGWRMGPVFLHMPMPSMGAAFLVALGALAALSARERTGAGQHVRTSLFQGALLFTTQIWQEVERANAGYHEIMAKTYPPGVHQQMVFECAGGEWIHVSIMSGLPPTCSLDEVIGLEGADRLSPERRRERFRAWNRAELLDALRRNNHAADAITPAGDLFDHPQTVANGMIVAVEDPDKGATTQLGVPIHLLGTPGAVTGPQPRAGEHTEEVLAGADRPAPARVRPPSPGGLALDGIRVLDFGQYLAGPFGPMILGDLGAQVIKVEPVTGDGMRLAGKPFVGCQRGKRSLALDLKAPAGLGVAHRLIASADVVHHNMTRGVAAKLGIDYGACRSLRADIVYCNTYAYGLPDPLGRFGGLDPLYQASAGLEYEAGAVHAGNPPLYLRFGMCDTSNALLSAVGVLLALFHRQHTGEGQELWTSLHDGGLFFSSDVWLGPDGQTWDRPHLDADLTGLSALYRLYRTQDDDWICLAAEDETHWPGLCRALGQPALADDPRFASVEDRCRHRADLESRLGALFLERTARYWTRTLDDHGVPNERPVDTFDGRTVLHDDDNVRLGLVAEYDHPVLGRLRQFGQLIDLSATPGRIWGPPPLVGQHSREILRGVGLLDGDIDALVASGVVYEPDANYLDRFRN